MSFRRWLTALVLLTAPVFAGCGGDESKTGTPAGSPPKGGSPAAATPKGPAVDANLARLVPANALGVLYVPSLDALTAKVKALVASIDPDAAKKIDVDKMLADVLGPAAGQLDRTGPIAVAFSPGMDEKSPPSPTFVVTVKDGEAAKKSFGEVPAGQPGPVVLGRFLALSQSPGFAPASAASPLLAGLPAGDVALRLDLARIVTTFQKQIDGAFGQLDKMQAPGGDPGATTPGAGAPPAFLKAFAAKLKDGIASAERLDLGIRLDGTLVNLDATFTAKEGSALAKHATVNADLAGLAACLPKDYPIAGLVAVRFEDVMGALSSLMEASLSTMPPESRDAFQKMMAQWKEMYPLLDDGMAMGMSMGASGIEAVGAVTAKDPKAYVAKFDEMVKGDAYKDTSAKMGAMVEVLPMTTVSGVEVRGMRMKFDWAKMAAANPAAQANPKATEAAQKMGESMFGKDGFRFRTAVVGKRVLTVIGGDDDLVAKSIAAAQASAGKAPAGLSSALAQAGGHPGFLVRVDLRAVIEMVAGFIGSMKEAMPPEAGPAPAAPKVPPGPPVPLLVFGSADGRVYRGSLSVDVGAAAKLIKSMMEQMMPKRTPGDVPGPGNPGDK